MLAQRIFPGKYCLRQLVADDDCFGMAGAVVPGKEATLQQRYLQCAEVSGVGPPVECVGQHGAGRDRWMLGNREGVVLPGSCSGHHRSQRCGAHTRHGAHPLQQRFVECVHFLGTVVFLCRKTVPHCQHVVGHAAHISRPQPPEALEQKARGNQQNHRRRDLYRKQRLAQCRARLAACCAPRRSLHRRNRSLACR